MTLSPGMFALHGHTVLFLDTFADRLADQSMGAAAFRLADRDIVILVGTGARAKRLAEYAKRSDMFPLDCLDLPRFPKGAA